MRNNNMREYIAKFNSNDEELTIESVSNQEVETWIEREVPKFECSDKLLEEIYYYRWWVFRKHIKDTGNGRIITEFLPKVGWAGPYNSINCANGHHMAEARWLKKDRNLIKEYIYFWLRGEGDEKAYSSWIADAVYEYALVSDDKKLAIDVLPELINYYEWMEEHHMTRYGLFWSYDNSDGMELSISGSGLRPTLNSYMYGNAKAIERIASWAKDERISELFRQKSEILKANILHILWDEEKQFFKVIPQEDKDDEISDFHFSSIPEEQNALEELGYIPWGFSVPDKKHNQAWKYLFDENYFKAPYGITTAQRNHPLFMNKASEHNCQWNGPVWPFATTQTLNGMIKLLQSGETDDVKKKDFYEQLRVYAKCHYRIDEDGKKINWLDENLHPDTGVWLARELIKTKGWNEHNYERGKDYNHSAFCDLVIRGICGIQLTEDDCIVVEPLISEQDMEYFLIEELPFKNHSVTVGYDRDGKRYQRGKGLWLELDGQEVCKQPDLTKIIKHI